MSVIKNKLKNWKIKKSIENLAFKSAANAGSSHFNDISSFKSNNKYMWTISYPAKI